MDNCCASASPHVILLCGLPGSGKTTLAKQLEQTGYVRLSIDEALLHAHGRCGVDYPKQEYAERSDQVEEALLSHLLRLIAAGCNVVLDYNFWERAERQRYRGLIEQAGARFFLYYLKADLPLLQQRLRLRAQTPDPALAFPITDELLLHFWERFEAPDGEGEPMLVLPQT